MTKTLPTPAACKEANPLCADLEAQISQYRKAIARSLESQSSRFIVILGPCSIDNPEAALTYGKRLKLLQKETPDLLLIMRTYVEKPRTTIGWTGFINDPKGEEEQNTALGIQQTRELLIKINQLGVPCAAELLNPLLAPYYSDLLSYASIGARTSESQIHRQLAASLSIPVGIKNPTGGDLSVAAHSVYAATQAHQVLALNEDGQLENINTNGNPHAHLILRGSRTQTNYCKKSMSEALSELKKQYCPNRFIVDCSHGNSAGCHEEQEQVAKYLTETLKDNPELAGIMLESYLESGNQAINAKPKVFGKSVTDACLSWETTECVVKRIAKIRTESKSLL